jgi:PAS domain S-box-containing protein
MSSPRIEVPSEIVQKWQEIVNLLAEIIHVPAALVMKLEPPNIKVFVSSESSGNPYEKDEVACFDPGLYCERVIKSQQQLLVPDALQDEEWKSNPDVKLGMISYLGFPIAWPDGHIFGTICVLDDKRNAYSEPYRKFLLQCRDVLQTDLKLLTTAMREGEERFRLVADAAPVLIWMSGPDKLCNYFNQPWLEFTGRPIELELGNGWAEGVHPEDLERCLDTYTKAFDGRESFKMEYRLRRHDREYRWVLDTAVPRFNRDGSFAGYIGSCIDITERRQAEDAIREGETRYRRIIETTNEGVWLLDSKLHTSYVNRQMAEMLGYEPQEMVGRSVFDFYFPEDVERKKQVLRGRQQGRREQLDERVRRKDASELWVQVAAAPVFKDNGDFDGALAMMSCITERKAAEEALRESEERFRLVANNAPVMIWMSGPDTKPTYFNQLWLDFTGLSETELLNGLAGIVHPEDYLQCHEVYCRGFDQRQPFRKECRLRRHDGQYRWMLDIGVPRFYKDGSFAGYIGSCIDDTDRKLAEVALTNMSRKLVEAQEQERARIARELHDDINQRLAMLAIELEQLQDSPSEVRSSVQELRKHVTEISNDVQALSHELHSSKLEYLGAIGGMKSWCTEYGERQGIQIEFKSTQVETAVAHEVGLSLFRVLQEALHNAAKHSGVRRIEVQLREDAGEIHLVVSDLGRGFDLETAMQGRGLGLASMQERVRLVNGTIEIQSEPMGGTTIDVRVPLRLESAPQPTLQPR